MGVSSEGALLVACLHNAQPQCLVFCSWVLLVDGSELINWYVTCCWKAPCHFSSVTGSSSATGWSLFILIRSPLCSFENRAKEFWAKICSKSSAFPFPGWGEWASSPAGVQAPPQCPGGGFWAALFLLTSCSWGLSTSWLAPVTGPHKTAFYFCLPAGKDAISYVQLDCLLLVSTWPLPCIFLEHPDGVTYELEHVPESISLFLLDSCLVCNSVWPFLFLLEVGGRD